MDPHLVLGVARTATLDQIRQRYRDLVKQWHPDVNPSPEAHQRMVQINAAWDQLQRLHTQATPVGSAATSKPAGSRGEQPSGPGDFFDPILNDILRQWAQQQQRNAQRAREARQRQSPPTPSTPPPTYEPIRWELSTNRNPTTLFKGIRATVFQHQRGRHTGRWSYVVAGQFSQTAYPDEATAKTAAQAELRRRAPASASTK